MSAWGIVSTEIASVSIVVGTEVAIDARIHLDQQSIGLEGPSLGGGVSFAQFASSLNGLRHNIDVSEDEFIKGSGVGGCLSLEGRANGL